MVKEQEKKKSHRGAWTLRELLQPISWGEFFGILLIGVYIMGYLLIAMFVVDLVRFYIFHKGTIILSRELQMLGFGVLCVVGGYYIFRKKKHKKEGQR